MINELVARVFASRDAAHLRHWSTKSYAEHQALGEFYDEVIDRLDALVEAHQGRFGLMKDPELRLVSGEILEVLGRDIDWMEQNHQRVCRGVSALSNLLDNILDLYMTTIYKLKNLK